MADIQIFKAEAEAGLTDIIRENSSVAYCSSPIQKKSFDAKLISDPKIRERVVAENQGQFDLYYLESILSSVGWNKNDDVFTAEEMWKARSTPAHKQLNFMHNENDIIGHMTGSYVLDMDGNRVDDDVQSPPDQFDIVAKSVIYTHWSDEANAARMEKLIEEIDLAVADPDTVAKWYVSMECLFPSFAYAIMDAQGEVSIKPRNESTAWLTKHLRVYGGTGQVEGHKIGRVLRDLSFSGKGIVSNPANTRSVILRKEDTQTVAFTNNSFSIANTENSNMSDILQTQVTELKSALAEAQAEAKKAAEAANKAKEEAVAKREQELQTELSARADEVKTLQDEVAEVNKSKAEVEKQLNDAKEALAAAEKDAEEAKKQQKYEKRKAALLGAGASEEDVTEEVLALEDLAFNIVVANRQELSEMKAALEDMKKQDKDKSEEEKKDGKKKDAKADTETLDDLETNEADLAKAQEDTDEDEVNKTQAAMRSWASDVFGVEDDDSSDN